MGLRRLHARLECFLMTKSRGIRQRYTKGTVAERIMVNSVVSDGYGTPAQPLPCRLSTYTKNEYGYGMIRLSDRTTRVHIEAYKAWVGPIATGLKVMHLCNVPACFEPTHLKLGTQKENLEYMAACGRSNRGRVVPIAQRVTGARHKSRTRPESVPRGEASPGSKLTEDQVRQIRRFIAGGQSLRGIARIYGVNNATVWNIAHGKTWAHVKEAV